MQKTNFRYEIVIHDDASTDTTVDTIREYEKEYPDLICGIYQTKNQWSQNHFNLEWMRQVQDQNCKGKYIALCEGDDYWIDSSKLQLQVDYLEKHPECMMTIHEAVEVDYKNHSIMGKKLYSLRDCLIPPGEFITQKKLGVPTASMVYRRDALYMEDFFWQVGIGDYPCLLYCLLKGSIFYFSRIMSVYRYCHEGSWSESMRQDPHAHIIQLILTIDFLEKYNEYSYRKYERYVISKIQICVDDLIASFGDQTISSLLELCKKYDEETGKKYHRIFQRFVKVWQQINNDNYLDEGIYDFVNRHKKIVIMGAGKYAGIMARQLNNQEIDFEGFIVSDNQKKQEYFLGKPVWEISELAYGIHDVGIIIAINPAIWEEIKAALASFDTEDYICPFLLI